MKPFLLLLVFCAVTQFSYSQNADSTDWCSVFSRIEKTGFLASQNDTVGPFVCNYKFFVLVADSGSPVPELRCKQAKLAVVCLEDLFFCNITEFNILRSIDPEKKKTIIEMDIIAGHELKYRMEFTVPKNEKRKVKARIIK